MTERAIWLKRENDDTLTVSVEAGGQWVEVIREHGEGPISHIVEPSGITRRIKEAATEASEQVFMAVVDVACTCPTLDGIKVVGSACPLHGFKSCKI